MSKYPYASQVQLEETDDTLVIRLMGVWVLDKPGTRPLAWWLYSCPASARSVGVVSSGDRPHTDPTTWALYPSKIPSAEKQRKFLAKHDLLTTGER